MASELTLTPWAASRHAAPPVGISLFVIQSMSRDIPISATCRGVLPFVAIALARVVILVTFPAIMLLVLRL